MPGRDVDTPAADTPEGAPPVNMGMATLATLSIGVKVLTFHKDSNEYRRAEILAIQAKKSGQAYYVHYQDFNKRLDEWVTPDRFDLTKEVEWPQPEKSEKKKLSGAVTKVQGQVDTDTDDPKNKKKIPKGQKRKLRESITSIPGTPNEKLRDPKITKLARAGGKENSDDGLEMAKQEVVDGATPAPDEVDIDEENALARGDQRPGETFSKEKEIEKLRVGGSMTQSNQEISRVRNLSKIQIGNNEVIPWYFSPYPIEFTQEDTIYICEFCLSYFGEEKRFERHRSKCTLLHPPGNEIYRDENVSFFEIDGRRQRTWCRNLCLLSKLFLDHKTLYYDVDPFLFYCMTTVDKTGHHLIGYFSKEKESAESYNVACILTLPQYQRTGFGKLLIAFSYLLSAREGKLGSPEKPLSDLGLLSYRAYWTEVISDLLIDSLDSGKEWSIDEISNVLSMTTADVIHTLTFNHMLRTHKGAYIICVTDAIKAQNTKQKERYKAKGGKREINPDKLQWKPPVFTAASRSWAW